MSEIPIINEMNAVALAEKYYLSHYPALSGMALSSLPFEKGWLVGPSKENDSLSGRMGVTLLIVGRDGSVEEASSSFPPKKIIADYLARHSS
jgi:hypothetical protein